MSIGFFTPMRDSHFARPTHLSPARNQYLFLVEDVIGTLSGFDRLVFRGTLRLLAHCPGMLSYLWAVRVLLKDFAAHAEGLTRRLKEVSEGIRNRSPATSP